MLLGAQAVLDPPAHLVVLLGPLPDDDAVAGRARHASRIDAYRE